ncbi:MAG: hypothetical protein RIQ47_576 [Bacteroidota bacterium]
MKHTLKKSTRQRTRLTQRILLVTGALGISAGLVIGWMVFMNFQEVKTSKATGNQEMARGGSADHGEILCEFTWEKDPVTVATLGPDAISCSKDACSTPGGRASTRGLSAGSSKRNIDMVVQSGQLFDQDGISITIYYRGKEQDGYFISRGMNFYFGIENGFLTVAYRTEDERGAATVIQAITDYELLADNQYRSYRFQYSPMTGRGEITVNGAPVWSHQGTANRPMYWKNSGNLMIAKGLNGEGSEDAILDNLVIRSTGSISPLANALLNFMLESHGNQVTVYFSALSSDQINGFTIERSVNGLDFSKICTLSGSQLEANKSGDFTYQDPTPITSQLVYYRLKQHLKSGKTLVHPVSAIRVKSDKQFSIERVNPSTFESSFNISYFLPKSGRVWIQLMDNLGTIVSSKTFEAVEGKNIHRYEEEKPLQEGTYTLNIMFDNKKVSTSVVKI